MVIKPLHVGFALLLVFLLKPFIKDKPVLSAFVDAVCFLVTFAFMIHIAVNSVRIVERIPFVDDLFLLDKIFAFSLVLLLMEAGRQKPSRHSVSSWSGSDQLRGKSSNDHRRYFLEPDSRLRGHDLLLYDFRSFSGRDAGGEIICFDC